jgi:hypothetical protein
MFDVDPLGDHAVHPRMDVSRDARDGPSGHTDLRLEHGRSVHDDHLVFRFWIDGKLRLEKQIPMSARLFYYQGILGGTLLANFSLLLWCWRLDDDACHGSRGGGACARLIPCQQALYTIIVEEGRPRLESKAW